MKKANQPFFFSPRQLLIGSSLLLITAGHVYGESKQSPDPETVLGLVTQSQKKVTGIITDKKTGEPIIGANVIVKGTTIGTTTDVDGKYSLETGDNAILVISFIGYKSNEISVQGKNTFTIVLEEDSETLDEVVVVAYGAQKKVNLSGSVASVNMSELTESRPITNLSSGLAGVAAGVQVTSANNRPGDDNASILVRGQGTLNNSAPLVIIDGVESNINSVNPQDVESMSILKDAASASIYGSRAANGVILITTKKGKQGALKLDYNGYVSFTSAEQKIKMVTNYADYMELMNEGFLNSNPESKPYFTQDQIDLWRANENGDPLLYPNTDRMDGALQTSVSTNHVLSASGATDKISYYTSFGYTNNPGVMENSGHERFNMRANVEGKIKPWITIGTNLSGYYAKTDIGTEKVSRLFTYSGFGSPGIVLRHPDGRYGATNNYQDDQQGDNPLVDLNNLDGDIKTRNLKARFYTNITPVKGLNISGSYTYDFYDKEKWEKPIFIDKWNFLTETIVVPGKGQSYITNYNQKRERSFMDAVANYENTLFEGKLSYTVMAGASQEQFKQSYIQAKRMDLIDLGLGVQGGAVGDMSTAGIVEKEWAMRSFFGRLNLGWDNKYLLEVNFRGDGSSRFLTDKRWGYFPSVSAAWRMDQEAFMENTRHYLDNLKLRLSYGSLGNNDLGDYKDGNMGDFSAIATYGGSNYILNNALQMGLSQTAISNAMLTWETTYVTNVGLDFGFLNNRLTGTLDYYNKRTEDILIELPAPGVHGTASIPRQNSAEVTNKGLEITLGWQDKINDFSYYVNGNITYNKNEVTKFKGEDFDLKDNGIIQEGLPIQSQYVRITDRLVQTQADLDYVQSIVDNAYDKNGNKVNPFATSKRPELGDLLYKDLNNDGLINDDDRMAVGNGPNPKFSFGLNLGVAYKGIDFSMLLQGSTGVKIFWLDNYFRPQVRVGGGINQEIADGRWVPGRTDATYPRLLEYSETRNTLVSDFWMQDKSYLKIRNIQLGYTLPKTWMNKIQMERIRVYGSLENFFTFTSYKGMDPEVSGINYPTMKQAVIGLNVTF